MHKSPAAIGAWVVRYEKWVVYVLGAMAFMAIPCWLGHLGISWDALNHHIYLGWTAEHPRFDRDYVAAAYQSYQYPYLYWPVYKLALSGATGVTAGVALAALHSSAIPPVWMMSRDCIPGENVFDAGMRALAVVLAFMTGAVLSLFDATSNDLLAGIPLLWAYALALRPIGNDAANATRYIAWSGVLAGVSVAFKLSNGPLAVVLPLLWVWPSGSIAQRFQRAIVAGMCLLASYLLVYGYWGWELWRHFGNPIYPLAVPLFEGLRQVTGWSR